MPPPPRLTPTAVEVSDDVIPSEEVSSNPSFTSRSLHEHQEEQTEETPEEDDWEPSPPTADERLMQAENFFSDEDIISYSQFAERPKEFDNDLRRLAENKIPRNTQVYNEVRDMLRVHQSRMDQQKGQVWPHIAEQFSRQKSVRPVLSDRSDRDQLWETPSGENRPPFTVKRPNDHGSYGEAIRADTVQGNELRKIENEAYSKTLENPPLVHEHIGERSQQTENEIFEIRATNRGRRRAAIQIALRSFATNHEQHYEGGWKHRVLRLPSAPLPEPSEPVITMPAAREEGASGDEPFEWTRKVLDLQKKLDGSSQTRNAKQPSQARGVIKAACQARLTAVAHRLYDFLYSGLAPKAVPDAAGLLFAEKFTQNINESGLPSPLTVKDQIREVIEYCDAHGWWLDEDLNDYANLSPDTIEQLDQYVTSAALYNRTSSLTAPPGYWQKPCTSTAKSRTRISTQPYLPRPSYPQKQKANKEKTSHRGKETDPSATSPDP